MRVEHALGVLHSLFYAIRLYMKPLFYSEKSDVMLISLLKKYARLLHYLKNILYICIDNRDFFTKVAVVARETEHNYFINHYLKFLTL